MTTTKAQDALDKMPSPKMQTCLAPEWYVEHFHAIREALALAAALERVPADASFRLDRFGSVWAVIRRDDDMNMLPVVFGETPAAAILAAVQRMEKTS